MKLQTVLFLLISLTAPTSTQVPLLDLTAPPDRGPRELRGGLSQRFTLPLELRITQLPDEAALAEVFHYEVTITNTGASSVLIPWSDDPLWENGVALDQLFGATLSLRIGSGLAPDVLLEGGVAQMFGLPTAPASVYALGPKESVRIRAVGRWSAAVSLKDLLSNTNGVARLTAEYRLRRGTLIGEAPASAPRTVAVQWAQ